MREGSPPPACHLSHVTCHVSCVTYEISRVTKTKMDKVVKLVGGGLPCVVLMQLQITSEEPIFTFIKSLNLFLGERFLSDILGCFLMKTHGRNH